MTTDAYWWEQRCADAAYTGPREDRHSSTVEAAALHERWRGQENGEDERPTLAEAQADEAWMAGEWGAR